MNRSIPFSKDQLEKIIASHPTPFHIYDEKAIRENAKVFMKAFDWVPGGFINYFAVKALPNPYILKILSEEGMGADCSSLPELLLAEKSGITGKNIMFSSNDTPAIEFVKAKSLHAIMNLDDISHINFVERTCGLPELICFRYNPGPLKEGNALIGKPEEAKYGLTHDQIIEAYGIVKAKGIKKFGLHTMVASNELSNDYFVETAVLLFTLAAELKAKHGIGFEFINLGGGVGIPYRADQRAVDLDYISKGIKNAYDRIIKPAGLDPVRIVMECGRIVAGPYGYLVTRAIHTKDTYKKYIGVDACMSNLMRPGMYGAYHHITVPGKENFPANRTYDVSGSLCENNDKFAIDRTLPEIVPGDLLVIHDTGAHGYAMGFNYNGKLRSAELLLKPDGSVKKIRRAETVEDYFATLDFSDI